MENIKFVCDVFLTITLKYLYVCIPYFAGRQQVAESAKFKRLAIVALSRDHDYGEGMTEIQNELSSRVMELAPANLPEEYKV